MVEGCQTNILDINEHKFLPSLEVAQRGPTHLPLTQRILHKRRSPIGPTSPGNRTSVTSSKCIPSSESSSSSSDSSSSSKPDGTDCSVSSYPAGCVCVLHLLCIVVWRYCWQHHWCVRAYFCVIWCKEWAYFLMFSLLYVLQILFFFSFFLSFNKFKWDRWETQNKSAMKRTNEKIRKTKHHQGIPIKCKSMRRLFWGTTRNPILAQNEIQCKCSVEKFKNLLIFVIWLLFESRCLTPSAHTILNALPCLLHFFFLVVLSNAAQP